MSGRPQYWFVQGEPISLEQAMEQMGFGPPQPGVVEFAVEKDGLYRIEAPGFVCGVELKDGVVVRAAPIVRRLLMGYSWDELMWWCSDKRWTCTWVAP